MLIRHYLCSFWWYFTFSSCRTSNKPPTFANFNFVLFFVIVHTLSLRNVCYIQSIYTWVTTGQWCDTWLTKLNTLLHNLASYWKFYKSSVFLKIWKSVINYIHVASKFRIDFVNWVFTRIHLFNANSFVGVSLPVFIYSFNDIKDIAVEWSKLKRSRMTWITLIF